MDWGWTAAIHPDDIAVRQSKWEHSIRYGEPIEVENRIRGADGSNRWFLVKGNPVRNPQGKIVRWIGTCIDIEDQKHNQQILEQQIKERTEELAEANTRLQEEMWEKDVARRELDEQNEKMLQDLTARSQRATILAQMGELLQSCMSKDEIFAAALGFAPKISPTRRGFIALLNAARDLAEIAGQWHDCQPLVSFEPSSCWALRTGQRCRRYNCPLRPRCRTEKHLPLHSHPGARRGARSLHFQATDENPGLADAELSLKTTFAGQVGLSVANIRLHEALRTQSIKDSLTGLYNRRYLEEMMERETRRAVRAEQGLGVMMLDLDHFKKFNDTYGHDAGDAVFRETASFLLKSVRAEDIVCRFGGEEFVVILTGRRPENNSGPRGTNPPQTARVVGDTPRPVSRNDHRVCRRRRTSAAWYFPKELPEAADAALYRAKREGRDRVMVAASRPVAESVLPTEVKLP